MRPIATLVVSIAMALAAIGLAVAAPGGLGGRELASAEIQAASGAVSIANSRAGQAVFSAAGVRPGEGVSGTVTIGNDGDRPGRFAVRATGVQDGGPPGAGKLSERVELVLFDVTDVQQPVTKYAGHPAGFTQVDLGVIAPGQEREYLFAATLPDGGMPSSDSAGDNRFQGATLSLGVEWSAANAGHVPTPTTTPPVAEPTAAPVTPTATPGPTTPTPTVPVALADALGLPAAKSCVKGGKLKLRLKAPAGAKVVSATVKVNGKVKARLKGAKARKPLSLRKLKRKTELAVSIKASNRRTYSASRSYKACKR
jgi:spore coat-associated protein N